MCVMGLRMFWHIVLNWTQIQRQLLHILFMQVLSFFSFDNATLHEYEQMFPMVSQSVCIFFLIRISLFPVYNWLGSHWFSCDVEFLTLFSHLVFEICIWPYVLLPFNEATHTNISTWLIWSHHCTSMPIKRCGVMLGVSLWFIWKYTIP